LERGPLCRRSDARGTSPLGHLFWLLGQLQDNLPLLVESEQRKRGKHNRADEQQRRNPRKERPQTQPQIYPDTAVNPGNEQTRGPRERDKAAAFQAGCATAPCGTKARTPWRRAKYCPAND